MLKGPFNHVARFFFRNRIWELKVSLYFVSHFGAVFRSKRLEDVTIYFFSKSTQQQFVSVLPCTLGLRKQFINGICNSTGD